MPYFENKNKTKLIITSYKVMYSSLKKQHSWIEVGRFKALKYISRKKMVYQFVRNPYQRVVSYYENKLKRSPEKQLEKDVDKSWEPGQKLILTLLNLEKAAKGDQAKGLLDLSFDHFLSLIPKLWNTDHHLRPQYLSAYLLYPYLKLSYSHIVKLEDLTPNIENELALDLSIHRNRTHYVKPWEEYFNVENCRLVYKYYANDFKRFGYEKL